MFIWFCWNYRVTEQQVILKMIEQRSTKVDVTLKQAFWVTNGVLPAFKRRCCEEWRNRYRSFQNQCFHPWVSNWDAVPWHQNDTEQVLLLLCSLDWSVLPWSFMIYLVYLLSIELQFYTFHISVHVCNLCECDTGMHMHRSSVRGYTQFTLTHTHNSSFDLMLLYGQLIYSVYCSVFLKLEKKKEDLSNKM